MFYLTTNPVFLTLPFLLNATKSFFWVTIVIMNGIINVMFWEKQIGKNIVLKTERTSLRMGIRNRVFRLHLRLG